MAPARAPGASCRFGIWLLATPIGGDVASRAPAIRARRRHLALKCGLSEHRRWRQSSVFLKRKATRHEVTNLGQHGAGARWRPADGR